MGDTKVTPGVRRILYVDSDPEARLMMQELLAPYRLDVAASDSEARTLARQNSYDVYILTGGAPASSGLELCAWLHRVDPRTPIVFCSSNGTARHQQAAIEAGALRYHLKPVDPDLLRSTLSLLLKLAQLESDRAMAIVQQTIRDELMQPQRTRDAAAARERARECVLRAKAYRAFRDAGGNRANFERLWPAAFAQAQKPLASSTR
jgi:DNA-binding response OmpR family regulator